MMNGGTENGVRPPRPKALSVVSENIPDELKRLDQWVVWLYQYREDKSKWKWTKPPHQPSGAHASHSDPSTWCTHNEALTAYQKARTKWDGIGIVLTSEMGMVGIDLDHCYDPEAKKFEPWAIAIIKRFNSYSEISPSGTGVRIFAKGKLPAGGRKKSDIEIYATTRYLTITGHRITGMPHTIEARQAEIDAFLAEHFPEKKKEKKSGASTGNAAWHPSDEELLEKAFAAKNGHKLQHLLDGDTDGYPSPSEAEYGYLGIIKFWTQDSDQIDRIYRSSKLYRDKWDERHYGNGETYGEHLIKKALENVTEHYESRQSYTGEDSRTQNETKDDGDPITQILKVAGFEELNENSLSKLEEALRNLASLTAGADDLRRAMVREVAIRKLEALHVSAPARLLDATLLRNKTEDGLQGKTLAMSDPEPWLEPVNGEKLLDAIAQSFRRFVVLPPHAAEVQALWCVHTHAHDAFGISPVLEINSPELECGKSVNQSTIRRMTPRALTTTSISMSGVFRTVEKFKPTLFVDEGDAFLALNEDLRGVLNSSHFRNDAFVIRVEGDEHEPRAFSTWCAKSIALIGNLPPTLRSRAITIAMKRKTSKDKVEEFHGHYPYPELEALKRQAWRWTQDNLEAIRNAKPSIPDGLINRTKDNWSPLFSVAEIAGGEWPKKCQDAALAFQRNKPDETSVGIMVLSDLQDLFRESEGEPLPTEQVLAELSKLDERPWGEWKKGKPITAVQLARLLKPFGIRPITIRVGDKTPKGYSLDDCRDAFLRYIPPDNMDSEAQHRQQTNVSNDLDAFSSRNTNTDVAGEKDGVSSRKQKNVADVADQDPGASDWEDMSR